MPKTLPASRRYLLKGVSIEARPLPPGLYLTATPIGNLEDVTIRALETLASADVIYCEDTRVTSKLLARYGIAKPLKPYHDHNAAKVRPALLEVLASGASIALVSDAGTPLVSDPGYKLVEAALAHGVNVTLIPGPSAPIMAAALAGLPAERFLFAGFLPARAGERLRLLQELKPVPAALVFFESAGRLEASLRAIGEVLGNRRVAVARELTKLHEEVVRGYPSEIIALFNDRGSVKGEVTILVEAPSATPQVSQGEVEAALIDALAILPPARAAAETAKKFGVSRKALYASAIQMKNRRGPVIDED